MTVAAAVAEPPVVTLARSALAKGCEAIAGNDTAAALPWLERAHRLLPQDANITLVLASVCLSGDPARAAALFTQVTERHDVRQAWLGLAAARLRLDGPAAAAGPLAAALSRHAFAADAAGLADAIALPGGVASRGGALPGGVASRGGALRECGGWCALRPDGSLEIHAAMPKRVRLLLDGEPIRGPILPAGWESKRTIAVTAGGSPLLGSPIEIAAIRRLAGRVEVHDGGIRGWAWHPGDPTTQPVLTLVHSTGRKRHTIVLSDETIAIADTGPLARPRSFLLTRAQLPAVPGLLHVAGPDGTELSGSPLDPYAAVAAVTPARAGPAVGVARRIDLLAWRARACRWPEAAILITHNDGGGVEQRLAATARDHSAAGRRPIVLRPAETAAGEPAIEVRDAAADDLGNLVYAMPRELPALLRLLRAARPAMIEAHHLALHPPAIYQLIARLDVPLEAHVHDYAWFCPRISLVHGENRYCGEPELPGCEVCVGEHGHFVAELDSIRSLRRRSAALLAAARRVVVPSDDAGARMRRHFDRLATQTVPHEDDTAIALAGPCGGGYGGPITICVAGAIGIHKGYDVLLECARDAVCRRLDLRFVVVGHTIDDAGLMDTGRVFVTGQFAPSEAVGLIAAQQATLGFVPSIWPETWCLCLSDLWRAGLVAAAFDIGAQAERIRRKGQGILLPLGLPAGAINDKLVTAAGQCRSNDRAV